jgi:hypothetical protein
VSHLKASSCGHPEARTDPFGEAHRVAHREPGRPEGLEGHGAAGLGIGLSLQVRRPTKQHSCSKVGSRGSIPSSAPGKSQVGAGVSWPCCLLGAVESARGPVGGAVSYTRVAFSG